jgi:hypothetical protein
MRLYRSDAGWQEREKNIRADAVIVSMSPTKLSLGMVEPAAVSPGKIIVPRISILNFTYKSLGARFHLCLCRFERDEDVLEVETQWVRARTSHFSYRSTVR